LIRATAIACALVVAVLASGVRADDRPAVVVTSGDEQKFGIALQKFAGGPNADAYREGLAAALDYSSLFRIIDPLAFLGPTTTQTGDQRESIECLEWTTIGADVFVEGVLRVEANQFSAEFAVWDLAGCQRKLRRRYSQASSEDPIVLAKRMADDIVEVFTGVRGVASTELAFVSKRGGNPEIYVMDADGGRQRAATANRSINNFPAWSPSGDSIAYTSYRSDNRPMLYISTRGQGKPGRILSKFSDMPQYRAVFDPAGRDLAVVMSPSGSSEIYRVDIQGTSAQRLTRNNAIDVSPTWSPDGRRIAFVSDRSGSPQIYVMNADGSDARRLTFDGNYNTSPAW